MAKNPEPRRRVPPLLLPTLSPPRHERSSRSGSRQQLPKPLRRRSCAGSRTRRSPRRSATPLQSPRPRKRVRSRAKARCSCSRPPTSAALSRGRRVPGRRRGRDRGRPGARAGAARARLPARRVGTGDGRERSHHGRHREGLAGDHRLALRYAPHALVTAVSTAVQKRLGYLVLSQRTPRPGTGTARRCSRSGIRACPPWPALTIDGVAMPARSSVTGAGYTFDEDLLFLIGAASRAACRTWGSRTPRASPPFRSISSRRSSRSSS
jgi:hypothetical protein